MLSALLQKLLFVNQFNFANGKIDVLGNRYIMLDASALLFLQEMDKTQMYQACKDSTEKSVKELVHHADVYKGLKDDSLKNIASLSKKLGINESLVINSLQNLF